MATHIAKNQKELHSMIEKQVIIKWLTQAGQKVSDALKEYIYSEFYNLYSPKVWERQFRILDAITVTSVTKKGNTYEISVFLDPTKVSYSGVWEADGSYYYRGGSDTTYVWNLMNEGIHGDESIAVTNGSFWEETLRQIGKGGAYDLFEDFKKYVGDKGILTIN